MKLKLTHLFLLFFCLLSLNLKALNCFVVPNQVQYQFETSLTQDFSAHGMNPCHRNLSIHLHLIANENYEYEPDFLIIENTLVKLNDAFKRSGISFKYCEIDSIENYKYNILALDKEIPELRTLYYKAGVINVFVVDSIPLSGANYSIEGHSFFPGGDDIIVVSSKSFSGNGLTHQMGHFLGLYHTFETFFGLELVDGSNCQQAGDLLCDTKADKHVEQEYCNPKFIEFDPIGQKYRHSFENIMSSHDSCRCVFTISQLNKMVYILENERSYIK